MGILNNVMDMTNEEVEASLSGFIGKPRKEVEAELNIIRKTIQELESSVPLKGNDGERGIQGVAGKDGKDGKNGLDGKDGRNGYNGLDGKDGKDGLEGSQGVSIVDVEIAVDNHLVITLSDGSEIDAGSIGENNGKDNFFLSTSPAGGGSSTEQNLFIQELAPVTTASTYMWIQTNIGNPNNFTFWFEDGL